MLKLRILTVACALPLVLAAMFLLPRAWWQFGLLVPVLVAAHEWSKLAGFGRVTKAVFLFTVVAGTALLSLIANPEATGKVCATLVAHAVYVFSAGFWLVIAPCWLWLKLRVRNHLALAVAGIVVLLPTWLALAQLQSNAFMLLLLLGVVWIADTAAYAAGRAVGKHKLAPAISPGKTWEGVAGALVAVTVYALVLSLTWFTVQDFNFILVACLGMTVFSVVGDLFESWLKRCAGVKDSGAILPGHGGMLDRIDGLVAAVPLAALLFI